MRSRLTSDGKRFFASLFFLYLYILIENIFLFFFSAIFFSRVFIYSIDPQWSYCLLHVFPLTTAMKRQGKFTVAWVSEWVEVWHGGKKNNIYTEMPILRRVQSRSFCFYFSAWIINEIGEWTSCFLWRPTDLDTLFTFASSKSYTYTCPQTLECRWMILYKTQFAIRFDFGLIYVDFCSIKYRMNGYCVRATDIHIPLIRWDAHMLRGVKNYVYYVWLVPRSPLSKYRCSTMLGVWCSLFANRS